MRSGHALPIHRITVTDRYGAAISVDLNAQVTLFCRAVLRKSNVHFLMQTAVARAGACRSATTRGATAG
jgi:hypothetical protein